MSSKAEMTFARDSQGHLHFVAVAVLAKSTTLEPAEKIFVRQPDGTLRLVDWSQVNQGKAVR